MNDRRSEPPDSTTERKVSARWGWLCGIGYMAFGLGVLLLTVDGYALLGYLCVVGGMVVGSVGLVGGWYNRSTSRLAPLKIAICACLILGIGGCVVDMTLPDSVNFPVTTDWLVSLVGESTNHFELVSLTGWILFAFGWLVTKIPIK